MKRSFLTAFFLLFAASSAFAEVRLAPAPDGEPLSALCSVEVAGEKAAVLTARTADSPFENYDYGGEYGFVSLDADEPVRLKIRATSGASLDNLTIRPLSLGLKPELNDDGSFDVAVSKHCQFSVETNGREHPLLVFVNPLETDVPTGDGVIAFGPGVHKPEGGKISLTDNQTLYLAAGAVVQCGIDVRGENVKICGRGVVDSNPWKWREGPTGHVVAITDSKNVEIEGITIRGASHWTIVPYNCDNVTIKNVKLCGGRVQNDDGINPCNSRNVRVSNCFIRTDDDCMALKGLDNSAGNCENIFVENCVFWCDRARIVLMGHESRAPYMRNIVYKNCDIIHSQARNFLLEPGEKMRLENVLFEDIRFETGPENALPADALGKELDVANLRFDVDTANKENWLFVGRPAVNMYMKTQAPGYVKNITIRNVSVVGPLSYCGILFNGFDAEHNTDGLVIENVSAFGKKLDADSPLIHIGDFTENVSVQ